MWPQKRRWCSIARPTLRSHPTSKTPKRSNHQSPLWTLAAIRPKSSTLSTYWMDHHLCRSAKECRPWRKDRQARHLSTKTRGKITWIKLIGIGWRCLKSALPSSKTPVKTLVWHLLHKAAVHCVARRPSVLRLSNSETNCSKWEITKSNKGFWEGENVSCRRVGGMVSWA